MRHTLLLPWLTACTVATDASLVSFADDAGFVQETSPVVPDDAGALFEDASIVETPPQVIEPSVPTVRLFPLNEVIQDCPNQEIAFDFAPRQPAEFDLDAAFWAMWFAERAMFHDDPNTPRELALLGFDRYQIIQWPEKGMQAYLTSGPEAAVLAFRGSTELVDWLGNFDFPLVPGDEHGLPGQIHHGFMNALEPVWPTLVASISRFVDRGQPLWITGHSLGGAMSHLTAVRLALEGIDVGPVYTFGAPRAGDRTFAREGDAALESCIYRVVNEEDIVPRLPPTGPAAKEAEPIVPLFGFLAAGWLRDLDYAHPGQMFWFESPTLPGLRSFAPLDERQDVPFWSQAAANGPIGLLASTRDQGQRHDPQRYLCRLLTERARD